MATPHPSLPVFETLNIQQRSPGVVQIAMARPTVFNAFDEQMIADLDRAFERLGSDDTVRVLVLAGEGKHFSAGADLQWMQRAAAASVAWNLQDARQFAAMLQRIHSTPKPVVARVQGAALGGGVGLTCACDFAIATSQASFAVSEAKFGILPSVIGPYLVNAVGKRQALRLALSTTRIQAAEALALGLVQQVVAADALDATIDQTVRDLLVGGPQAQREIKQLYAQLAVGPVHAEVQELTAQTISRVRGTEEAREGFSAFLDKRPARWIPQ